MVLWACVRERVRLPLIWATLCRTGRSMADGTSPCRSVAQWSSADDLWWLAACQWSSAVTGPWRARPKLGYSWNAKGLPQTNKFNHGLPFPAGCFNAAGLQRSRISLCLFTAHTDVVLSMCSTFSGGKGLFLLASLEHKSQVLRHHMRIKG